MAIYRIKGLKYNKTPRYFDWDKERKHPYFEVEDEQNWDAECNSLDEAKDWLMSNHPDYYQGSSILCLARNEIALQSIPSGINPPI